jgi:hypothetical protein
LYRKDGMSMVIINNISNNEWKLILSVLRSELHNSVMNELFPKRQEEIRKLIKKIEGFTKESVPFKGINSEWKFE